MQTFFELNPCGWNYHKNSPASNFGTKSTSVNELHAIQKFWPFKLSYVPREQLRPTLRANGGLVPTTVPEAIVPDVVASYQDDVPVQQIYSDGPIHKTDPTRFFIPFLSMGPNNQLEGFLESVFLAIKLNRLN